MSAPGRGILTLAVGQQRYIDMAIQLVRSIRLNSPGQTVGVATDRPEAEMKRWFDVVVPVDPAHPVGLVQKVYLYDYSPFRETLFIDADCLVVRDLSFLWRLFDGLDVSTIGVEMRSGSWAGLDIEATCSALAIPYVVGLNGGVYYFRRTAPAERTYRRAQALISQYDELGIERLRGEINDEPLMSLAMAMCGQRPVNDGGLGMRTRIGQTGPFRLDVLKGHCRFTSGGVRVEPAIMHFGSRNTEGFYYRRERRKMHLHEHGLSRRTASTLVNLTWNGLPLAIIWRNRLQRRVAGAAGILRRRLAPQST